MTPRSKLILVAVVAFLGGGIAGGVAGGYVATYFTSRFFADGFMLGNTNETQANVTVLQHLRDGQTEKAIELLEVLLDGNILSLHASEENSERTNKTVKNVIQKTKEYRARYPRHTQYPEVDEGVSKTLGLNAK